MPVLGARAVGRLRTSHETLVVTGPGAAPGSPNRPASSCDPHWLSMAMTDLLRCELFPGDLDAAVRFYVDALEFDVDRDDRSSSPPYVALSRGAVRLALAQRGDVADVADVAHRRPPVGVELVLEVADPAAGHEKVIAAGWPVEEGLTARPWGLVDFRVLDPAGYYWRITSIG